MFLTILSSFVLLTTVCLTVSSLTLKGVVSVYSIVPGFYVKEVSTGEYVGFSIDLLDAIAHKVGFNYSLVREPKRLSLLSRQAHLVNGAVGEVYRDRADFAIGNIDNYNMYQAFVDFTEPILAYQHYAALISRLNSHGLHTVQDLLHKAESNNHVKIGCLGHYYYYDYIVQNSLDSFNKRLTKVIDREFDLVLNITQALDTLKCTNHINSVAYLTKSNMAQFLAERDCDLTVLYDHHSMHQQKIIIPLRKESPHLSAFNKAIQELHRDGTIERLKSKHWPTGKCRKAQYN